MPVPHYGGSSNRSFSFRIRFNKPMGKMKYLKIAFFVLIYSLVPLCLFAQYLDGEDAFFSYERFYLKAGMLKDVSSDGNVRSDIKAFMQNFSDGIYAISAGDPKRAKTKLLRARAIWPEYFGTYFLLARVNEDTGDYNLSARFYKSYLNKLQNLSDGRYRISESLIKAITPYGIENYHDAHDLVEYRLKGYGIDLSAVRPFYTISGFLRFLIILVVLAAGYSIVAYVVVPRINRKQRINNPPEGAWACKKCGTHNINIRKECEKCGETQKINKK